MNAYNLMGILCIFCHLEQVCTVGCTVVERRKEAASFDTGGPAWANQSGAVVDAPVPASILCVPLHQGGRPRSGVPMLLLHQGLVL